MVLKEGEMPERWTWSDSQSNQIGARLGFASFGLGMATGCVLCLLFLSPTQVLNTSAATKISDTFATSPNFTLPLADEEPPSNVAGSLVAKTKRFCLTKVPMYYVNLDRSTTRKEHMETTFGVWGKLTRVPAIDMSNSTQVEEAIDTRGMDVESYRQAVKANGPGEVGLTASHLKAIKLAYDNGDDVMLLFEDDMSDMLVPFWRWSVDEIVDIANKEFPDWDIIQLQTNLNKLGCEKYDLWKYNPASPFVPRDMLPKRCRKYTWGGGASLLSRKGMAHVSGLLHVGKEGRFDCYPVTHDGNQPEKFCIPDALYWRLGGSWQPLMAQPPLFTYMLNEGSTGTRTGRDTVANDHLWTHYMSILESVKSNIEAAAANTATTDVGKDVAVKELPYMKRTLNLTAVPLPNQKFLAKSFF